MSIRSLNISWISLNLLYNVANNTAMDNSAIYYDNSKVVTFHNAFFSKLQFNVSLLSTAIRARRNSEICKFENVYHGIGSTLYTKDSEATFCALF